MEQAMATSEQQIRHTLENADCLHSRDQVEQSIQRMAGEITRQLQGRRPLVLCVMNGGIVLTGALLPRLDLMLELDYIHATRYRNTTSGSDLQFRSRPASDMTGRSVLVVDDILDEGMTLAGVMQWCREQGAGQVLTAVLVDKQHERRAAELPVADFTGLTTPDRYLFGYGMDYRGYGRNAPGIYAVQGL